MEKIKNIILFFVLFSISAYTFSRELLPQESAALDFYKWYTLKVEQRKSPMYDNKVELKEFISTDLSNKLERLIKLEKINSDYFTKSQDYSEDWSKNIEVHNTDLLDDQATVLVDLNGDINVRLAVQLKETKGKWKIVEVLDVKRPD